MKYTLNEPINLGFKDKNDTTVSEAIYTIYKNDEGWMFSLDWSGIELLFDGIMISQIYQDVIKMLTALTKNEPKFTVSFLDTGFTAIWCMELKGDELTIDARWTSIISNDTHALEKLRGFNVLTVKKTAFLVPWEILLKQVKNDLLKAGYTNRLKGFEYLNKLK